MDGWMQWPCHLVSQFQSRDVRKRDGGSLTAMITISQSTILANDQVESRSGFRQGNNSPKRACAAPCSSSAGFAYSVVTGNFQVTLTLLPFTVAERTWTLSCHFVWNLGCSFRAWVGRRMAVVSDVDGFAC